MEIIYCLYYFQSYTTKERLKKHERICRDYGFCYLKMPCKNNKILKYIQGEKLLKVPSIIYADLECLLQKINTCKNNPEKSCTETKTKHKPYGCSFVTCCSFDKFKNERKYYSGKDSIEIFCKDLKDQAMKMISFEKKEITPLTNEAKKVYEIQKKIVNCHAKNNFVRIKIMKKILNRCKKSEIIVIMPGNIEELLIVFAIYAIKYQKRFL